MIIKVHDETFLTESPTTNSAFKNSCLVDTFLIHLKKCTYAYHVEFFTFSSYFSYLSATYTSSILLAFSYTVFLLFLLFLLFFLFFLIFIFLFFLVLLLYLFFLFLLLFLLLLLLLFTSPLLLHYSLLHLFIYHDLSPISPMFRFNWIG